MVVSRLGEVNASRIEGLGGAGQRSLTVCWQKGGLRGRTTNQHEKWLRGGAPTGDPLVIMHKWNPEPVPEPAFDACCRAKQPQQPQQHSYSPEGGPPWPKMFQESFVQLRMETGDTSPTVNGP
jgi:hypothetical protein